MDSSCWITPAAPVRDIMTTCTLTAIDLTPDANAATADDEDFDYRARITFSLNQKPVTYNLYTNPVFVALPPCKPSTNGAAHEIHVREFRHLHKKIYQLEDLYDLEAEEEVIVINATRRDTEQINEVVARAWCAERGRNAVVRKADGPCFACAVRAASRGSGLGTGVLIWTD